MEVIILVVVIFFASFAEGMSGIGMALVCMAMLPAFFDFYQVMILTKILGILFETYIVTRNRGRIRWGFLAPVTLASLAASWLGIEILFLVPVVWMKRMLGMVLTVFSAYFLFSGKQPSIRPGIRNGCVAGTLSGLLGGALSVPGPPLVFYYLGVFGDDKTGYLTTICASFLFQNVFQLGLQLEKQEMGVEMLYLFGCSCTFCAAGYFLGQKLFQKTDPAVIRRILYAVMLLMGIRNLLTGYVFN